MHVFSNAIELFTFYTLCPCLKQMKTHPDGMFLIASGGNKTEVYTSACTPHTHRDFSVSSCVIRKGNRYCHTEKSEHRKRPKWNWQTGGGVTGLKLICAPSLHLSHIVSARLSPSFHRPLFFFSSFSIDLHTFSVEVILKTRFGPIKLKLYSPSWGCLIESDIDTITTDKLD